MSPQEVEEIMNTYPDRVADALHQWKLAIIERDRVEALAYFRLKANASSGGEKVTETWLNNKITLDDEVHKARLDEILAESTHTRLYEKLLSAKRISHARAAF